MEKLELSLRQKKILDAIKKDNNLKVDDISLITNTAPATVRRDLTKLAKLNYIEKSYGKISILNPINRRQIDTHNEFTKEQVSLIKKTAKLIHSGNVILINNNKFNAQLVDEIVLSEKFATIVTNSLEIFDRSKDSDKLNNILLAGLYNKETKSFSGTTTYSILSSLRADCFIMHPSGIDFDLGFLASPTEDLQLILDRLYYIRQTR